MLLLFDHENFNSQAPQTRGELTLVENDGGDADIRLLRELCQQGGRLRLGTSPKIAGNDMQDFHWIT